MARGAPCKYPIVLLLIVCTVCLGSIAGAASREMTDLGDDLQEYLESSRMFSDPADRLYISEMAIQNIYKQWVLWSGVSAKDEILNSMMGSSYTRFILLQYYLNNPSWVEWGFRELETFLPSYKAYIDSTTDLSYGEQLSFIKKEWLKKFAVCNAFNELVPLRKLIDNPISLVVRSGCFSDEDKYVLRTAEEYLNRRLTENKEYFSFYLPRGEYEIADEQSLVFPKVFAASGDTAQFVYLTPNYRFNFIPVAQIFTDTGIYYDTLSPSEFELIRLDEGRAFEFDNLEFGRYLFKVKPPYKLVDGYPNKLIIPKEEFGANYMDKHSELFNKDYYDKIIVGNNETLVYTTVERTQGAAAPADDDEGSSSKKDDKKKRNRW